MDNANTLLTLIPGVDPDYPTFMARLRQWTWDDAIISRGHEQIATLRDRLKNEEETVVTFARCMTAMTDGAIKHVARAEGTDVDVDRASIVRVILKTARQMESNMLWDSMERWRPRP